MVNVGQDREESVGLQRENQFVNLERMRDRQHTPSVMVESCHIECTERSPSRTRSYVFHEQETQKLQLEIVHLRRKLRYRKRVRRSPSPPSSSGLGESRDCSYHHWSRTPSCKSFSMSSRQDKLEKDNYKCKKRSSHLDMGNNVIAKHSYKSPSHLLLGESIRPGFPIDFHGLLLLYTMEGLTL